MKCIRVSWYDMPGDDSAEIKKLGINYLCRHAHGIADFSMFWGVTNIPQNTPEWVRIVEEDPNKWIGLGFDKESAKALEDKWQATISQ